MFNQVVREATTASNPDSDDEQLADPAIPKSFSERELVIINYSFAALSESFCLAKNKHCQNHAGKQFFTNLGKFVMSVLPLAATTAFPALICVTAIYSEVPQTFLLRRMLV